MATDPAYAATPRLASGLIPATNDTSLTAPTNVTTLFTGGASGSVIYEIRIMGVATTVTGVINFFLYDGTTYHLFDSVGIVAITPSATQVPYGTSLRYTNLWLPDNTWSVRVAQENQAAATCKVTVLGANL